MGRRVESRKKRICASAGASGGLNESFCQGIGHLKWRRSETFRNRQTRCLVFEENRVVAAGPRDVDMRTIGATQGRGSSWLNRVCSSILAAEILSYLFLHCDEHDELCTDPNRVVGFGIPPCLAGHTGCSDFDGRVLCCVSVVGKVARIHQKRGRTGRLAPKEFRRNAE